MSYLLLLSVRVLLPPPARRSARAGRARPLLGGPRSSSACPPPLHIARSACLTAKEDVCSLRRGRGRTGEGRRWTAELLAEGRKDGTVAPLEGSWERVATDRPTGPSTDPPRPTGRATNERGEERENRCHKRPVKISRQMGPPRLACPLTRMRKWGRHRVASMARSAL